MLRPRLVVAALLLSACSLDTNERDAPPPVLRFVNAAPGSPPVGVHLNGSSQTAIASALAFRDTTPCLLIFPSSHQVAFVGGGSTLATVTAPFDEDQTYLVALVKTGTTFRAVIARDDVPADSGTHAIRVINASETAGDVYITAPGEAPTEFNRAFTNLAPQAASTGPLPSVVRPGTATRIRLFNVGSTSAPPRADILIPVAARRITTVVLTDPVDASDPGALVINACG